MVCSRNLSPACLLLAALFGLTLSVHAAEPFEALLEKQGVRYHGPETEKGDLRIDSLSRDFTFVASLDSRIKEGRAARMASRPTVSHYRLSRKEYQNTAYALLGLRYVDNP